MRKTKIVCTIGPASSSENVIKEMCYAGMNVARLNFSHGTHEEHKALIDTIKKVREELNLPIAIMLDTKGPECRIKTFEKGVVNLKDGDDFIFTTEDVIGNEKIVSVGYKGITKDLAIGDRILLNNGLMSFIVEEISGTEVKCKITCGGELRDRKSMSFPGRVLSQQYISEQDRQDIIFGIENDVDYIACSFVSRKQDLIDVKALLNEKGGEDIELIAKIENQAGIDNIEDICEECDGIMIGRGDMGVEIPYEQLPAAQKKLITKCRLLGKRVITATEMLESMIYNSRPTRAEISDVANAVYDGTSALMLSGETAMGKYPVQTIKVMSRIAETTEQNINYKKKFYNTEFQIRNTVDAISHATCAVSIDICAKAIVACSLTGGTTRMISRFRSPVDIIGLTTNEKTYRRLALSWGVTPVICETVTSTDVLFYTASHIARDMFKLSAKDKIVVTGGAPIGRAGTTNLIKVEEI